MVVDKVINGIDEKIKKIDEEIERLYKILNECKGTKTEVYTRIVGYHRPLDGWNKGKREEYKNRKNFNDKLSKENILRNKRPNLFKHEKI